MPKLYLGTFAGNYFPIEFLGVVRHMNIGENKMDPHVEEK